jgi:hypothetical protein
MLIIIFGYVILEPKYSQVNLFEKLAHDPCDSYDFFKANK